jgi:hypothetical protein
MIPCGHRYRGQQQDIHGLPYYVCERAHPWAQQNNGGLFDAR